MSETNVHVRWMRVAPVAKGVQREKPACTFVSDMGLSGVVTVVAGHQPENSKPVAGNLS
jgi:hypothetical protein